MDSALFSTRNSY